MEITRTILYQSQFTSAYLSHWLPKPSAHWSYIISTGAPLFAFLPDVFFKTTVQMHENKSFSSERISNHCGVVIMFIHMYIPTATNHYDFVGTVTIISHIPNFLGKLYIQPNLQTWICGIMNSPLVSLYKTFWIESTNICDYSTVSF